MSDRLKRYHVLHVERDNGFDNLGEAEALANLRLDSDEDTCEVVIWDAYEQKVVREIIGTSIDTESTTEEN